MAKGRLAAIAVALVLALPVRAEVLSEILPPNWTQLTVQQKQVLAPLQSEWDSLDKDRRNKWLRIADRYPRMSAEEQQRVQTRMKQWTDLTPEQRRRAREHYQRLQNISPTQRQGLKEKWREYESLPDAEKKRLKESNRPRRLDRNKGSRSASQSPVQPMKDPASPAPVPAGQPPQDGVSGTNSPNKTASPDSRSSIEFGTISPHGSAHEELAIPRPSHGD